MRERPHVICHMLTSLDGRIVIREWKLASQPELVAAAEQFRVFASRTLAGHVAGFEMESDR